MGAFLQPSIRNVITGATLSPTIIAVWLLAARNCPEGLTRGHQAVARRSGAHNKAPRPASLALVNCMPACGLAVRQRGALPVIKCGA
jgi:hypothetical protein